MVRFSDDGAPYRRYACDSCGPHLDAFWTYMDGESGCIVDDFAWFMENEMERKDVN